MSAGLHCAAVAGPYIVSVADLNGLGRLHTRPLQFSLLSQWQPHCDLLEARVLLDQEVLTDLPWLLSWYNTRSGIPLCPSEPTVMLMTDMSLDRWGTSLSVADDHLSMSGKWPPLHQLSQIGSSSFGSPQVFRASPPGFPADTVRQHHNRFLSDQTGGDSISSTLQPGVTDRPAGPEFSPQDPGSPYSGQIEHPHGLSVEEESCPDEVGSGPCSVPGHGGIFWSVASD